MLVACGQDAGADQLPQVRKIQAPRLAAPQTESADRFQQHRVTLRRQRTLPAAGPNLLDPTVRCVEQGLHLVIGQRAPVRLSLEPSHMRDRVPLIEDLPAPTATGTGS